MTITDPDTVPRWNGMPLKPEKALCALGLAISIIGRRNQDVPVCGDVR
jgi:hypothetical protein